MMRNKWMAVIALAVTACGGGDAGENEDTGAADTPAPAETPAQDPAAQGTTGPAPEGATPEMVAQGQQIFTGKGMCLSCHGASAEGTPLAPNLTDQTWLNIPSGEYSEIQTIVRNGVPTPKEHPSPMPPMGGAQLSDQEIQAVAAYVYSVSHQGG